MKHIGSCFKFLPMIKTKKKKVVHYIRKQNAEKKNKKNEAKLDHTYRDTQNYQN